MFPLYEVLIEEKLRFLHGVYMLHQRLSNSEKVGRAHRRAHHGEISPLLVEIESLERQVAVVHHRQVRMLVYRATASEQRFVARYYSRVEESCREEKSEEGTQAPRQEAHKWDHV